MFDITLTQHLADLSKLAFTESELRQIGEEMRSIVALMDTVASFEANEVYQIQRPVPYEALRPDEAAPSFEREAILQNAKDSNEICFKVPKVV